MPVAVLLHRATSFYKSKLFEEIEEKFYMISTIMPHEATAYCERSRQMRTAFTENENGARPACADSDTNRAPFFSLL